MKECHSLIESHVINWKGRKCVLGMGGPSAYKTCQKLNCGDFVNYHDRAQEGGVSLSQKFPPKESRF